MSEELDTIPTADAAQSEMAAKTVGSHRTTSAPIVRRPVRTFDDEEENEGFFKRRRGLLIFAGVVLAAFGWVASQMPSGKSEPVRKAPEPQKITLVRPPPPPPPPPKVQPPPPKDEKRAPVEKPAEKAEDKPKPADKPPEGLGTSIKGSGAGMAGLGSGRGMGVIGGTGKGRGGKAAAYYAGQVQSKITEALRGNPRVRKASIKGVKFSVVLDASGRITGVKLIGSTGDAAMDEAIRSEILTGIQLREPPPGGKPMTITMMLRAQRPN